MRRKHPSPRSLPSGDAPDLVAKLLDEPELAVGSGSNPERIAGGRGQGKLGNLPGRGDAPDLKSIGKPEVAIGTGGNPVQTPPIDGKLSDCGNDHKLTLTQVC